MSNRNCNYELTDRYIQHKTKEVENEWRKAREAVQKLLERRGKCK